MGVRKITIGGFNNLDGVASDFEDPDFPNPALDGAEGAGSGLLRGWPLLRELQAIAAGRVCGPEERRRCRVGSGGFADWACGVCEEFLRPEAISSWTWHLLFLYRLSRAGYPFKANDLSLETWLLLGTVQRELEKKQRGKDAQ